MTLGAKAAEIAANPQIGVVLRVAVLGDELAGPQHGAPALAKDAGGQGRLTAARIQPRAQTVVRVPGQDGAAPRLLLQWAVGLLWSL